MTRYLCLNDIHATKRPPSSCTESYYPDLLDLLWQTVDQAREHMVDAVIWAGDVFHHKAPSRTPHEVVLDLEKIIVSYPCPVLIVPGNHDMQNDRIESVGSTQPLGELYMAGAQPLTGWARDGVAYGVPWLQGYGNFAEDVPDDGQPHNQIEYRVADALASYRGMHQGMNHLVVAHAPLYPPGRELEYEYFPASRWAEAMGGRGYVLYGHVHEPHGVYEVGGVTFCNYGALSRGSLHEYNLTRQVGFTLWDSETGEFEFVPLRYKAASEVFRLAEAAEAKTATDRLDEFLEDIGHTRLDVLSVESVMDTIRRKGVGAKVEALSEELLAEAQAGRQK